jgi:hypothetical protein
MFDAVTTSFVSAGSSPPKSSKTLVKTGMRKRSIPASTSTANVMTTAG